MEPTKVMYCTFFNSNNRSNLNIDGTLTCDEDDKDYYSNYQYQNAVQLYVYVCIIVCVFRERKHLHYVMYTLDY